MSATFHFARAKARTGPRTGVAYLDVRADRFRGDVRGFTEGRLGHVCNRALRFLLCRLLEGEGHVSRESVCYLSSRQDVTRVETAERLAGFPLKMPKS